MQIELADDTDPEFVTLIKALALLSKHSLRHGPTHCEHDTLWVAAAAEKFTKEELEQLDEWGFFPDTEYDEGFTSYRYGSG